MSCYYNYTLEDIKNEKWIECNEEDVAKELNAKYEGKAIGIKADVRNYIDQQEAVRKTVDTFGSLDVLIANAGLGHFGSIEEITDKEWKEKLSDEEYYILRQSGTERPGTSILNHEKRLGVYQCAGCELPLFNSDMKFDSGTGWPSFFDYIPNSLGFKTDFKIVIPRKEYHCIKCGGHHGHVFKDGPEPTGLRYCNNGFALKFVPNTDLR